MATINELKQNRAKLVADARAIHAKAETEKRDMNAGETESFNKIMDVELGTADKAIEAAEKNDRNLAKLKSEEERLLESSGRRADPNPLGGAAKPATEFRYTSAGGRERVIPLRGERSTEVYNSAFRRSLIDPMSMLKLDEQRALAGDSDTAGGFLVVPQQFAAQMIAALDNAVFIRRLANVLPPIEKAESLGIPTRENDLADTDWTSEIGTGSEDSSLNFGKRELKPHPLAKRVKISKTLLRKATLNPEAIVMDRMTYKFGVTEEKAFLSGSGAGQPLGVFTASSNGISTGRDVSTGNTTTSIQADNLLNVKYSLKSQYWARAQWVFHRDALKQISKLKDGVGQYLWSAGLKGGSPDTLCNMPVNLSEYAPNTFTTGQYVGILGDFSQYWVVDSLAMQVQTLLELYAETNQNGYIGRKETDGMPVLEEAFARVALG